MTYEFVLAFKKQLGHLMNRRVIPWLVILTFILGNEAHSTLAGQPPEFSAPPFAIPSVSEVNEAATKQDPPNKSEQDQPVDLPFPDEASLIVPATPALKDGPNADQEVRLKSLESEKAKSLIRLESTAEEIARRWFLQQQQAKKQTSPQAQNGSPEKMAEDGRSGKPSGNDVPGTQATTADTSTNADAVSPPDGAAKSLLNKQTSGDSSGQGNDSGSESAANSESPSTGNSPGVPIVDGAIDRLSLAASLFATDQFRECLTILDALDLKPLSLEEQQWHDYLVGSCYRKLGNRSEAENYYRSVLQRSAETWLAASARWWLDYLERRAQLEAKASQVQTTLENWRKEIDALKSPN